MHLRFCLLTVLMVLCVAPKVSPEKLSVLLPNQNQEFELDHDPGSGQPSGGLSTGLSPPLGQPLPPVSQVSLASPPAPLPIGPPAASPAGLDVRNSVPREDNKLRDRVPTISALYEVPDPELTPEGTNQGTCEAQTVVVTSREVIVSTSVSRVSVPTTVVQQVTTTQVQLQTALQTSYVTLAPYTEYVTLVPKTVYLTTTSVQRQVTTSTQFITSRVTELAYRTLTETRLRYETVYRTTTQSVYSTTTIIQYVTPSCTPLLIPTPAPTTGYDYSRPSTTAYNYPSPSIASSTYESPSGGIGKRRTPSDRIQGPVYGPYYHASLLQGSRKGLFRGWKIGV